MADTLPEGTDHVLPGAAETSAKIDDATADTRAKLKSDAADLRDKAAQHAADLRDQASEKARTYAEQGKARASSALDEIARFLSDSATQIEDKIGKGYGDYARRAGEGVAGFAGNLRDKPVDDLIDDARDLVRRSPAIAIGAAAAAGFVIARLVKAGSEALNDAAQSMDTASTPEATKANEEGDSMPKSSKPNSKPASNG